MCLLACRLAYSTAKRVFPVPAGPVRSTALINENALRGLRAEIDLVLGILGHALIGLEHQVELADIGKVVAATVRAWTISLPPHQKN